MIEKERILKTFLDYVRIDSESGEERAMCLRIEEDLADLGLAVTRQGRPEDTRSNGWNLLCTIPGAAGGPPYDPLIITAHLDTVCPGKGIEPVLGKDGIIRSKGDTVLGGDDKCGVTAMIELARLLKEHPTAHRTIQLIFTVGEESGQYGAKALEKDLHLLAAKKALVLDSSGPVGRIVTSAPGHAAITASITGRASHAGNRPLEGISAITTGARAVMSMKLGQVDSETTANIGTLSAIGPTNVVNPRLEFAAEARSRDEVKLKAQTAHMIDCLRAACSESGASLTYRTELLYHGFLIPEDNPFLSEMREVFQAMGVTPFTAKSGGGSDANALNALGITALNLGVGMNKGHSVDEELDAECLYDTVRLLWHAAAGTSRTAGCRGTSGYGTPGHTTSGFPFGMPHAAL